MSADYLHRDEIAANDMDCTGRLASDFQAYSAWRGRLSQRIVQLSHWLAQEDLEDAQTQIRIQSALEKLKDDKLNIAFVAEFSRGKSELINALFFARYGKRVLPSAAGRTTMCPTEILYDAARAPAIQLLPIETRAQHVTTSEYRRYSDEWITTPLDIHNADALLAALSQVSQTKRVTTEVALELGLFDENNPDQASAVSADGLVEIPMWRHAVINFPHPLLEQGLVILDTPGLNAIGTEPELTLNLLPNAHAVLFVLAADTGVTRSDIAVWRDHLGKGQPGSRTRLVVLNKIDCLWDELKTSVQIEAEIASQSKVTASLLGINVDQVFAVSAQKALVAKARHDETLLARSQLLALEAALSGELLPAKQEIVRDHTLTGIEDIVLATRSVLSTRRSSLLEQLDELGRLRGKNQDVVLQMMDKVQADKRHFEQGLVSFQALRSIFGQQTARLLARLDLDALTARIGDIRIEMERSWFSFGEGGLRASMERFFRETNADVAGSAAQLAEIQAMMAAMYKKFSKEHGLGQVTPPPFSTLKYHKEIARLEKSFHAHFNTIGRLLTTSQGRISRKFFETVASRVVYVFEVANRDVAHWLKAVMAPMETQVREHQLQLRRRLDSIKRIHNATETLAGRIKELEEMDHQLVDQMATLDQHHRQILAALNSELALLAA